MLTFLAFVLRRSREGSSLGDAGAASRVEEIFMGEILSRSCSKLSPMKIPSTRLAAPESPGMGGESFFPPGPFLESPGNLPGPDKRL